jgi:PAS domain S-box-containing protein
MKEEILPWLLSFTMLFLVVLLWSLELISRGSELSFQSVIDLHKFPVFWFIDLLPFVVFFLSHYHFSQKKRLSAEKQAFIRKHQDKFENYAEHAERLGIGDYSTPLHVEGDNDELGDALQYLQGYLKATERKKRDETWISDGKEMASRVLRLYNQLDELSYRILESLCKYISMEQGAIYLYNAERKSLVCTATHAYNRKKYIDQEFRIGQGLVGQCAYEMDFVYRTEIPEDYVTISSGIISDQKPQSIVLIPLISDEELQGVMEFASIKPRIRKLYIQLLLELGEIIGRAVYNLRMNRQTEQLLKESREMTEKLKANEITLQENASLMKRAQVELEQSNIELESKVKEAENARGKLHWMLENASELISIYDDNLSLTYISPSVKNILGYSEEEYCEGKDFGRLTREGAKALKELINNSIQNSERSRKIQYSFVKKGGEKVYLESTARNLLNDPAINGVIVNSIDITERMRAEKEERLKTRMQALSENSLDLIIRMSTTGQFYYVNPVVEDYISLSADEMINKNISELDFNTDLKKYFEESLADLSSDPRKTNEEITLLMNIGNTMTDRIISFDAIPEVNNNELETILFVGHDITEIKKIEKELNDKNKKIQDSINYSRKIQNAIIPDIENLQKTFPKSFLFFKPRDVISGDFPWFMKSNHSIFLAAVDCTGHGVPGSMLSFIAYFLLKEVIKTAHDRDAGEICDLLHEQFRKTLNQEGAKNDTNDGLDIALCKISPDKKTLNFAGAHRQLLLLREGELTEYKGNRKAIGGIELFKKADEKFLNHKIDYRENDRIFFFTDGLTDQLGGPYGRKYSPGRVRDLILEHPGYTMQQYHQLFDEDFSLWKKDFRQLDDVLMIGLEF